MKQHPGQLGPFWSTHRDVIPPGAVVCDYESSDYESLHFDLDPEPQVPMVTVAEFLEGKGWQRQAQKHTDTTFEMVLVKGETELVVRGLLGHKRTELSHAWSKKK